MEKTYESKRDGWLVALLWAAVAVMLIVAAGILKMPAPVGLQMLVSMLMISIAGFMLWLLYGTRYILTSRELVIRSGPFRWAVPLDSITEVYPTHNPLSSPACSLDRLHIRYRNSVFGVMISPENKLEFLRDLTARTPGLKPEKERLTRA